MRLEGKIAIITGGGSGLGEAMAIRFAEEGAKISIVEGVYLCSKYAIPEIKKRGGGAIEASYVTGQLICVDGGFTAV